MWLFACVDSQVRHEGTGSSKSFAAYFAFVRSLSRMRSLVGDEIRHLSKTLPILGIHRAFRQCAVARESSDELSERDVVRILCIENVSLRYELACEWPAGFDM